MIIIVQESLLIVFQSTPNIQSWGDFESCYEKKRKIPIEYWILHKICSLTKWSLLLHTNNVKARDPVGSKKRMKRKGR